MKIVRFEKFNIEGICKVEFQRMENVKRISAPNANWEVDVELKNNISWNEIEFTRTREELQIIQQDDDTGTWYDVTVRLSNPRLSPDKSASFAGMEGRKFVLILTDQNGYKMLVGSLQMPAYLNNRMTNPGRGVNARSINFDAVHDREPFFVAEQVVNLGGAYSNGYSSGYSI